MSQVDTVIPDDTGGGGVQTAQYPGQHGFGFRGFRINADLFAGRNLQIEVLENGRAARGERTSNPCR